MREEATWQASYDYWRMADIVDTPSTVFLCRGKRPAKKTRWEDTETGRDANGSRS